MTTSRVPAPGLVLVDGFAGSGKSTLAQRLCLQGRRTGADVVWWHEHDARHPVFRYGEVEELLALRLDRFEAQVVDAWAALARRRAPLRIVEGAFLQLTVGVMVALDAPSRRIIRVLREIDRQLAPLQPVLVHLFHRDTKAGLLRIREHRGEYWLNGMVSIVGRSRYGRRHGVRTLDGLIAFYQRQRAVIDAALPHLTMRIVPIEISRWQWEEYFRRAWDALALGPAKRRADAGRWTRYVGRYGSARSGAARVVCADGSRLYLHESPQPPLHLLPVERDRFEAESLPIRVTFGFDSRRRAQTLAIDNRLVGARPARQRLRRQEGA